MDSIKVEGIGTLEVPDSFRSWAAEKQQQFIKAAVDFKNNLGNGTQETTIAGRQEVPGELPAGPLNPEQMRAVAALVRRGIPEAEAIKTVTAESPFMSDNKMSQELDQLRNNPDVTALEKAWQELSPEQQNSMLAQSPWVAAAASFLDNLLPVSLLWALPDGFESQVRNAMEQNKGVADKAAMAGTVLGLIGGPLGAAKIARGGFKFIKNIATRRAGHINTRKLNAIRSNIKDVIGELKSVGAYGAAKGSGEVTGKMVKLLEKNKNSITDLLEDWGRHIYEQKWSTDEIRNFLENRLNDLPSTHVIKQVTGGKDDLFDTFFARQPKGIEAPSNFKDRIWKGLQHRASELSKNIGLESAEFATVLGVDGATNYSYAKQDFKDQGFTDDESHWLALSYAFNRTPHDFAVEAVSQFANGNKIIDLLSSIYRTTTLIEDLDAETGKVRADSQENVHNVLGNPEPTLNQGGILNFNEGGEVSEGLLGKPEVNTNVVDRGKRNREAIGDFFKKTFDSKQGIHPDVKGTLRSAAELVPIVGDALAAEEVFREMQKEDPKLASYWCFRWCYSNRCHPRYR